MAIETNYYPYQNTGICYPAEASEAIRRQTTDSEKESSEKDKSIGGDTVEISSRAYQMQSVSKKIIARSGNDYLSVSQRKDGTFVIHFTDSAMVNRTVQRGYLEINGVRIELSDEVKESLLKTDEKAQKEREREFYTQMLQHDMEVARQQGETMKKYADDMAKALEIARRISRGGQVPATDEQKLLEYDPKLYMMAKNAGAMAKEHEKYDSLYEDEEESGQGKTDKSHNSSFVTAVSCETQMSVSLDETMQIQDISVSVGTVMPT